MKLDIDELGKKLKKAGYKLTPQRLAVLEMLVNTTSHPDAQTIYEKVRIKNPKVSFGTVYRTLKILKESGVVTELNYGEGYSRYDGNPNNHYHFQCVKCRKVSDIDLPVMNELEEKVFELGHQVLTHRLEFYGLCNDCK